MKNIMVDLETMSTAHNAAIVSIGAVEFTLPGPNTEGLVGSHFYRHVDLASCIDRGMKVDGGTVMWWMNQSAEARQSIYRKDDLVSIHDALVSFHLWCRDITDAKKNELRVWGNGAAFDNVILANAYAACGLEAPWNFWNDMCYRTIKNLSNVRLVNRHGVYHNALDDARTQAEHLIDIYRQKNAKP